MTDPRSGRVGQDGSATHSRLRGLFFLVLGLTILGLTAWLVIFFECKISG